MTSSQIQDSERIQQVEQLLMLVQNPPRHGSNHKIDGRWHQGTQHRTAEVAIRLSRIHPTERPKDDRAWMLTVSAVNKHTSALMQQKAEQQDDTSDCTKSRVLQSPHQCDDDNWHQEAQPQRNSQEPSHRERECQ